MKRLFYSFAILASFCVGIANMQGIPEDSSTTTKADPTTTTEASSTTSAPLTTTTTEPTLSTTTEPTSTTTETTSTTTEPTPLPTDGSWNVTEDGITCIRADLKIRFKIPVDNKTDYLLLPPNALSNGSTCNATNTTELLVLHGDNFVFSVLFEKDTNDYFVSNISLVISSAEGPETYHNDSKLFDVRKGNSYICQSMSSVIMGNVTMEIFKIHIQAFGAKDGNFGSDEQCEADDTVSDIVPIVVACALAVLIIVVLIAYLIGRRRSRQKGYNSV